MIFVDSHSCSLFFTVVSIFHSMHSVLFSQEPKVNSMIIFSRSINCKIIEAHRFLRHMMTSIAYFWLKSIIYPEKLPVMTNNKIMRDNSFISIYVF